MEKREANIEKLKDKLRIIIKDYAHTGYSNASMDDAFKTALKKSEVFYDELILLFAEAELRNIEENDCKFHVIISLIKEDILESNPIVIDKTVMEDKEKETSYTLKFTLFNNRELGLTGLTKNKLYKELLSMIKQGITYIHEYIPREDIKLIEFDLPESYVEDSVAGNVAIAVGDRNYTWEINQNMTMRIIQKRC